MEKIYLNINTPRLTLEAAMDIAKKEAGKKGTDPMLISWYDRSRDQYSPNVNCCGGEDPAWVIYARTRGADLWLDINLGDYVFIFKK